jgi:hypothetical protein
MHSLCTTSLTTLVTVAPGLALTQPVEISIGYYSPAAVNRITQSYVAGTGNRFLHNDFEGDGKPRRMRVDISLSEPKPGGGFHTFAFSTQVGLDPLYDVTLSPLQFFLQNDCDPFGNSEIRFSWHSPDDQFHQFYFSTGSDKPTIIERFAWARIEVSTAENLHRPVMWFWEEDPVIGYIPFHLPSDTNLVPGQTKTVKGFLQAADENICFALVEHTITYTLRFSPFL